MPLKNSGRSVADWAPSLKKATDACVLASNNASPAQRLGAPERGGMHNCSTPRRSRRFPSSARFTDSRVASLSGRCSYIEGFRPTRLNEFFYFRVFFHV